MSETVPSQEKVAYQGSIVEIVEYSPDGVRTFEKARRAPGVRVIIEDGPDHILLTKEYRHEIDSYDFRLPGGKVFDRLEEYNAFLATNADILGPAKSKAKDEALEEAGIIAGDLSHIYTSKLGATMEWDLYYFVSSKHTKSEQALEEGEDIEAVSVSRDEARAMCLDGRIDEERSALVLLRYLN